MPAPGWLTARPIAHRGLHDLKAGVVENTPSAVAAAIDNGYAIEVDLQMTADGEAVVFHDETLDRLTRSSGPVIEYTLSDLKQVRYRDGDDEIQSLPELLNQVSGKVPLVLELKSLWTGDTALVRRTAGVLSDYAHEVAVMSFDPALIIAMRRIAPDIVRGVVSCAYDDAEDWPGLSAWTLAKLRYFAHFPFSAPQFVSYDLEGLRFAVPRLLRACGLPLITWTVRSPADAAFAATWADQITFEGFRPAVPQL